MVGLRCNCLLSLLPAPSQFRVYVYYIYLSFIPEFRSSIDWSQVNLAEMVASFTRRKNYRGLKSSAGTSIETDMKKNHWAGLVQFFFYYFLVFEKSTSGIIRFYFIVLNKQQMKSDNEGSDGIWWSFWHIENSISLSVMSDFALMSKWQINNIIWKQRTKLKIILLFSTYLKPYLFENSEHTLRHDFNVACSQISTTLVFSFSIVSL